MVLWKLIGYNILRQKWVFNVDEEKKKDFVVSGRVRNPERRALHSFQQQPRKTSKVGVITDWWGRDSRNTGSGDHRWEREMHLPQAFCCNWTRGSVKAGGSSGGVWRGAMPKQKHNHIWSWWLCHLSPMEFGASQPLGASVFLIEKWS